VTHDIESCDCGHPVNRHHGRSLFGKAERLPCVLMGYAIMNTCVHCLALVPLSWDSVRCCKGTTKTPSGLETTVIFVEHSPQSQKRSSVATFSGSGAADPTPTWKSLPSCMYRNVAEHAGFAHFDTIAASKGRAFNATRNTASRSAANCYQIGVPSLSRKTKVALSSVTIRAKIVSTPSNCTFVPTTVTTSPLLKTRS